MNQSPTIHEWEEMKRETSQSSTVAREKIVDRLEIIRSLSNVVGALENLLVQCDGLPGFETLILMATAKLEETRALLKRAIHAS